MPLKFLQSQPPLFLVIVVSGHVIWSWPVTLLAMCREETKSWVMLHHSANKTLQFVMIKHKQKSITDDRSLVCVKNLDQ